MPKTFEKPKPVLIASAIIKDCCITFHSGNVVKTNKTKDGRVILTCNQIAELTDPFDQRLLRMIDVRVRHLRSGNEDIWFLDMVRFSPEMTFDSI